MRDWLLGGTILSSENGTPNAPLEKDLATNFDTFPNPLIGLGLRSDIP
jgi:hypothetical protein